MPPLPTLARNGHLCRPVVGEGDGGEFLNGDTFEEAGRRRSETRRGCRIPRLPRVSCCYAGGAPLPSLPSPPSPMVHSSCWRGRRRKSRKAPRLPPSIRSGRRAMRALMTRCHFPIRRDTERMLVSNSRVALCDIAEKRAAGQAWELLRMHYQPCLILNLSGCARDGFPLAYQ